MLDIVKTLEIKKYHNRISIAAWNYVIQQISFMQLLPSFFNSMISVNHDKVEGHSVNGEILIKGFKTLL